MSLPLPLQKLVREFCKLPSIGEKSAVRLAYHLINNDRKLAESLAVALREAIEKVRLCETCYFLTEEAQCTICRNAGRDQSILCVVEKPMDLIAIERTSEFHGLYHVLHGLWAPLRGQGPEQMRLSELLQRVSVVGTPIQEVIIATSSTVEGDATALYIARALQDRGIRSTRPAQGIPKGGELEYADDVTLTRAFSARNVINFG